MPLAQEKRYVYADLLEWDDGKRYELYDGQAVALASPSQQHQEILMALSAQIYFYLQGKKCKVIPAPFDVRLFEEEGDTPWDVDLVVQPDITIICDEKKLDGHGCKGAPDMIVEILSPSTRRNDRIKKYKLYQKAGVKEYWIVDPDRRMVLVHELDEEENCYGSPVVYTAGTQVPVGVLEDCTVDLAAVFPEE